MERPTGAMPKLGFLGFGEAASNLAEGLAGEGLQGMLAYDVAWQSPEHGALVRERARRAGVALMPSSKSLIESAEVVISATSARLAVPVAEEAAPHIAGRLYVDVNAASPVTKGKVAGIIAAAGGRFVDVAMMGRLPAFKHKVPMLASGPAAAEFQAAMAPYGMRITVVGDTPGSASAIKMFRSIIMKGLEALALEMMVAAHRFDAQETVLDSIVESTGLPGFKKWVQDLLVADAIHAERRMHEMEEVISTLEEMGLDPIMARATRDKLQWSAGLGLRERFKGEPPAGYLEVLAAIRRETG